MTDLYPPQQPPQIGFLKAPVSHSPSPLSFGFGLSSLAPSPSPFHPSPSREHSSKGKRRLEDDDMDTRSPTPEKEERQKRAPPKRLRVESTVPSSNAQSNSSSQAKSKEEKSDVDVGVLLASLPPTALLPILNSLLTAQPSLKGAVLALIPRPSVESAIKAISAAAKKVRDAYPWSFSSASASSTSFGFGAPSTPATPQSAPIRDEYVLSRIRTPLNELQTAVHTYIPYFSLCASTVSSSTSGSQQEKPHPNETFLLLTHLTSLLISSSSPFSTTSTVQLPPLAQSVLQTALLQTILKEWNAWLDHVDTYVNRQAGMFGSDVVHGWANALDEFAAGPSSQSAPSTGFGFGATAFGFGTPSHAPSTPKATGDGDAVKAMRELRDRWVVKVGWLIGRRPETADYLASLSPQQQEQRHSIHAPQPQQQGFGSWGLPQSQSRSRSSGMDEEEEL